MENNLIEKIDLIEKQLSSQSTQLKHIEETCILMQKHIIFIENLYNTMRTPISKLLSFFN